jgi:hypothetical protein
VRDRHREGTLRLFDRFCSQAGGHPAAAALRGLIDRPVAEERHGFKYDLYLAPQGWGATINDRWEGEGLLTALAPLARRWGHDLTPLHVLRRELGAGPELTVAVGLDQGGRTPRLKAYLQEARWGLGVASETAVRTAAAGLGCSVPDWLPARSAGVVALVFRPDGPLGLKAYYGGATPHEAARGAPPEAQGLAASLAELCPIEDAWYYLTVRMDPRAPARVALNKIYNATHLADGSPSMRQEVWEEVGRLFAAAGRDLPEFPDPSELITVPSATAWEAAGSSADVYIAAWLA